MTDETNIVLQDKTTGEFVEAVLFDAILDRHLEQHENVWRKHLSGEQHDHWDWRRKRDL